MSPSSFHYGVAITKGRACYYKPSMWCLVCVCVNSSRKNYCCRVRSLHVEQKRYYCCKLSTAVCTAVLRRHSLKCCSSDLSRYTAERLPFTIELMKSTCVVRGKAYSSAVWCSGEKKKMNAHPQKYSSSKGIVVRGSVATKSIKRDERVYPGSTTAVVMTSGTPAGQNDCIIVGGNRYHLAVTSSKSIIRGRVILLA